jgi:hypothetical protein
MRKLAMFDSVSLDGFFTSPDGDMSWLHAKEPNPEWEAFVAGNASGNGALVFGRITYQMMAGWWPTPAAAQLAPQVAAGMNAMPKYAVSRTEEAAEQHTVLRATSPPRSARLASPVRSRDLGSGVCRPVVELDLMMNGRSSSLIIIGSGCSLFAGVATKRRLARTEERAFGNGNVSCYERTPRTFGSHWQTAPARSPRWARRSARPASASRVAAPGLFQVRASRTFSSKTARPHVPRLRRPASR